MVRIRLEPIFNILRFCVWNSKISGQKTLFVLIWASFKCHFWSLHLKIVPGTNFHENITSQTQIINVNASLWYSKTASFRKNEGILVQICNIHILVTIQVTRLKFGSFPCLFSMVLNAKCHGFLKNCVSGAYCLSLFDVEFPCTNLTIFFSTDYLWMCLPVLLQQIEQPPIISTANQTGVEIRFICLTSHFWCWRKSLKFTYCN